MMHMVWEITSLDSYMGCSTFQIVNNFQLWWRLLPWKIWSCAWAWTTCSYSADLEARIHFKLFWAQIYLRVRMDHKTHIALTPGIGQAYPNGNQQVIVVLQEQAPEDPTLLQDDHPRDYLIWTLINTLVCVCGIFWIPALINSLCVSVARTYIIG